MNGAAPILLGLSVLVACGDVASMSQRSDAGTADASIDARVDAAPFEAPPPPDPGKAPPDPGGPAPDGSGAVVLAIRKMYFGDTDRHDVAGATAWKQYGFDVDGKISDATSTDVCTLTAGAASTTQTDGASGTDNSFGENVLPLVLSVAGPDFAKRNGERLASGGAPTILFVIDKLGSGASYSPLPGRVLVGAPFGSPPAWDGTDAWPIDASSLNGGDVGTPKLVFNGGYMNGRVWVGAPPFVGTSLPLLFGDEVELLISAVQVAMRISADGRSASGILAGVLPTNSFLAALRQIAGRVSKSLCTASALDALAQKARQASDILRDGSNMPGVPCDAISIGIGFEASIVNVGAVVTRPPPPDACLAP